MSAAVGGADARRDDERAVAGGVVVTRRERAVRERALALLKQLQNEPKPDVHCEHCGTVNPPLFVRRVAAESTFVAAVVRPKRTAIGMALSDCAATWPQHLDEMALILEERAS